MNNIIRKILLVLVIIALCTTLTLAIWGGVGNALKINVVEPENTNHDFKFNGKLYFYDNEDALITTYKCDNDDCDYATFMVDDNKYAINYHKNSEESIKKSNFINNRYVFIKDGTLIKLFDLNTGKVNNTFTAVKNYGIGIENDYYLVANTENKWGVLSLASTAALPLPCQYDFIGLHNKVDTEKKLVRADEFIVKSVEGWKIVNINNASKSSTFLLQIYDYSDKYVITKSNDVYYLNYINGGNAMLLGYNKIDIAGNYLAVIDNKYQFYIMNPETNEVLSEKIQLEEDDDTRVEVLDGMAYLFIDNEYKARLPIED